MENNKVDFNGTPGPTGQEGFNSRAQRDKYLGGRGKVESRSPGEEPRTEDAKAKVDAFLQFAKQIGTNRTLTALAPRIGDVIDKRYFQQEPPPKQSALARFLGRAPTRQVDWAAYRRQELASAYASSPSRAKAALLKEVMPKYQGIQGRELVEDFASIIDYDFNNNVSYSLDQPSREPLSTEQAHEQVETFLKSIRENDAKKEEIPGRGMVSDVSVAIDKALQADQRLRNSLDGHLDKARMVSNESATSFKNYA